MTTDQTKRSRHQEAVRLAVAATEPNPFAPHLMDGSFLSRAEEKAEQIIAAYFLARGWKDPSETSEDHKPVAHLVWLQGRRAPDDVEDYYEVARPGDKCVDGSPPFPVWDAPVLFYAASESGHSHVSKESTDV